MCVKHLEGPLVCVVDAVICRYPSRTSWRCDASAAGVGAGLGAESWTLLGSDLRPVGPVESFLAFLSAVERSPNTVKAYAHDLKD